MATEYAPRILGNISAMASAVVVAFDWLSRTPMTSVSVVEVKVAPRSASHILSSSVFTRLPLCATATGPLGVVSYAGWAFSQ